MTDMNTSSPSQLPTSDGVISGRPVLDLTHLSSPDELSGIHTIKDVAVVVASEALAPALARIQLHGVAQTLYVPDDSHVRVQTGSSTMGGAAFESEEGCGDVLVVVGSLTFVTPVTAIRLRELHVVGSILAPSGSENALAGALTTQVGSVSYFPYQEGQQVKAMTGQNSVGAEFFANTAGARGDILLVSGQLMITDRVTEVGYAQVIVSGQLVASYDSQPALAPVLVVMGQSVWYRGRDPRLFMGKERLSAAFFDLIEDPMAMVIIGSVTIEDDVSPALLKEKVSDIALIGTLRGSAAVVPVLQFLTTSKTGKIATSGENAD